MWAERRTTCASVRNSNGSTRTVVDQKRSGSQASEPIKITANANG
jgi:hypothetical protein